MLYLLNPLAKWELGVSQQMEGVNTSHRFIRLSAIGLSRSNFLSEIYSTIHNLAKIIQLALKTVNK